MARFPAYEKVFESFGLTYQYHQRFALDDFSRAEKHSQIRLRTDRERVNRYAAQLAGRSYDSIEETWPAIVVAKDSKGKMTLAEGYHRTNAAALAGLDHFPAYLVEVDSPMLREDLAWELNKLVGQEVTDEERNSWIIRLYHSGTKEQQEIAKMVGVSNSTVSDVVNAYQFLIRAKGVAPNDKLTRISQRVRSHLHTAIKYDSTFKGLVKLIISADLTTREAEEALRYLAPARSEEAERVALEELALMYQGRIQETRAGKTRRPSSYKMDPTKAVVKHLTYMAGRDPSAYMNLGILNNEERKSIGERWRNIAKLADEVASGFGY